MRIDTLNCSKCGIGTIVPVWLVIDRVRTDTTISCYNGHLMRFGEEWKNAYDPPVKKQNKKKRWPWSRKS